MPSPEGETTARAEIRACRFLGFTACVVSREQLEHLAVRSAELATARRVRIVAQLLLAAGLVFVLLRLRSIWRDSNIDLGRVGWGWLGYHAYLAGVRLSGFVPKTIGLRHGLLLTEWIEHPQQRHVGENRLSGISNMEFDVWPLARPTILLSSFV